MFALLSPHHVGAAPRIPLTTLPFRIYLVYVGVVLLGIPDSVKPALTTYRAAELIAGCFVLLGAYRVVGSGASARIEATLYRFTAAVVASVWVGRVLFPDEAVNRPLNEAVPLKWELVGVYPRMAANTVGALGMLLALWSLARWVNARPGSGHRGTALAFTLLGVATTIGAQYRTGYVGLVAGGLILFVLRRPVMAIGLLAIVAFALVWSPSLVTSAQPYVLRGQTPEEAQQLSGRTDFWAAAIPVWKESPIIGKGLWTASRYEVLVPLGLQGTASVHSTWVEALVGTGVLGVSLLGAAVLLALRRGWRVARAGPFTTIGPLVLLVAMSARSITGNLFESFGHEQLVFLAILLALEDPTRRVSSRDASDSSSVLVRAGAGP